jgi:hypothetical protein
MQLNRIGQRPAALLVDKSESLLLHTLQTPLKLEEQS